ncbi:MAG: type II toxin-antitoxin system VapC family toxin [Candidatus Verstraetearchaeota archaeon]|nr:type II toxin-antitoxin system VapC family toxin [Candidatus Verstraetearchaeota archaeon]
MSFVFVIDSSTIAKFLLKEEGWRKVKDIIIEKPYTLDLALKEVANAIWRRTILLGNMNIEKAFVLLDDLLKLKNTLLIVEEQDLYLNQALKIAIENKIPIYDTLFITQAISKQAVLITSDENQYKIAQKLNVKVLYI